MYVSLGNESNNRILSQITEKCERGNAYSKRTFQLSTSMFSDNNKKLLNTCWHVKFFVFLLLFGVNQWKCMFNTLIQNLNISKYKKMSIVRSIEIVVAFVLNEFIESH